MAEGTGAEPELPGVGRRRDRFHADVENERPAPFGICALIYILQVVKRVETMAGWFVPDFSGCCDGHSAMGAEKPVVGWATVWPDFDEVSKCYQTTISTHELFAAGSGFGDTGNRPTGGYAGWWGCDPG